MQTKKGIIYNCTKIKVQILHKGNIMILIHQYNCMNKNKKDKVEKITFQIKSQYFNQKLKNKIKHLILILIQSYFKIYNKIKINNKYNNSLININFLNK